MTPEDDETYFRMLESLGIHTLLIDTYNDPNDSTRPDINTPEEYADSCLTDKETCHFFINVSLNTLYPHVNELPTINN